jgi:choline dehydrogenase
LDRVATAALSKRRFLALVSAAALTGALLLAAICEAIAVGENQAANKAELAGALGATAADELSKSGASVLVVEAGGDDTAPTVSNSSIWFLILQSRRLDGPGNCRPRRSHS